jgi:hypothetical protein
MGEPRWALPNDALTEHIGSGEPTRGSEPSQYPEEEKAISDSLSSGERSGKSLNRCDAKPAGVVAPGSWDRPLRLGRVGRQLQNEGIAERPCERAARERDSRVREIPDTCWRRHPSNTGYEEPCVNLGGPSPKAKYSHATDSEPVP